MEQYEKVVGIMHNNVISFKSIDVVFKKIRFIIQKGLAGQLVACLQSHSLYSDN